MLLMVRIRKFKISDTYDVVSLISETFAKYNKNEGTKEAIKRYIEHFNPKKNSIKKSFLKTSIFFVAIEKEKIVGVVRGNKNRIVNLFVKGRYHGKGIGKKLMQRFETECRKHHSSKIRIRSSLYAIPFYQRLGYKKTTGIRNFMGLKIQPMRKILN